MIDSLIDAQKKKRIKVDESTDIMLNLEKKSEGKEGNTGGNVSICMLRAGKTNNNRKSGIVSWIFRSAVT